MEPHIDFDGAVAAAWRSFRVDLADRLAQLERADTMTVAQSTVEFPGGPHGVIRFSVSGSRRVRATVVGADLHTTEECRREQVAVLEELGWRRLRRGDLIVESGRRGVDALALTIEHTLRSVWEVLHPTFLAGHGVPDGTPREPEIAIGVAPRSCAHLRDLVVAALERISGAQIDVDSDGDIRIPGTISSWLRVASDTPAVEMVACIVDEVFDRDETARHIASGALRGTNVTLLLVDDRLFASMTVEASVFHEHNLASTLAAWIDSLDSDVPTIREALSDDHGDPGAAEASTDGDTDRLPEALMTLIHLDQDGPLTPAEVAEVCGNNRGDILEFMRLCSLEEISWRAHAETADEVGDTDEAAACRHEQHAWAQTVTVLRQALRLVVLPPKRPRGERRPTSR